MAWETLSFAKGAFKKLAGLAHTANENDPPNESIPSQVSIGLNQIMGETIPGTMGSCDPQDAVDLVIVEYIEADLVLVAGSDNKCYSAYFAADYNGHFGAGVQGALVRDSTFAVPLAYNVVYSAADHSGGFSPDLYDNAVRVANTSLKDWWFDPFSCTVTSETDLSLGATGTIQFYVWIGKRASDNVKKCNYSATSDPDGDDDETTGYAVGSMWVNTSTDDVFMCTDASDGAANWETLNATMPTAAEIADAVLEELVGDHSGVGGSLAAFVNTIKGVTDTFAFTGNDVKATLDGENVDLNANQSGATIGTVNTLTGHTAQTGDSFARLGAPAVTVSADILAIKTETALIVADTGELQTDWANDGRLDLLVDAIKAKTDNLPGSPAAVGSLMGLANDAITSAKYDESTAFPVKSADTGATQIARVGADGDTLETLSDQVDGCSTHSANDVTGGTTVATAETNIRGADSDTLETLSDQIDGVPTTAEFEARTLPSADYNAACDTAIADAFTFTTGDVHATLDSEAVNLADDAITSAKYDESTAFPVKSADTGASQIARVGADGDTLETLSDQMDDVPTVAEMEARTLSTANATLLNASVSTIATGTATATTLSTTQMSTDLSETTNNHYNNRLVIWISGNLEDQAAEITAYNGTTKTLTYSTATEAPAENDTFVIV